MSMVNRAAGRSSNKNVRLETASVTKQVIKKETNSFVEKEKKQPTAEQKRFVSLIDKSDFQNKDIQDKIKRISDIVIIKTDDEILSALHDCDYKEDIALQNLLDGKPTGGWSTTTKKKKNRTASASKNEADVNNHGEGAENVDDWDKDGNAGTGHQSERGSRGFRGRRGGGPRQNDRSSFNSNRKWRGRENKENERGNVEDGGNNNAGSGRDYHGRGDRMTNGPSRPGRGGRGARSGRGLGGTRTFQSRDNNDRGGGFPRQIDTWNNPETESTLSKVGPFPSPEDWDNEEYTGSLADSKVFTPSTTIEPEVTDTTSTVIETEIKEESMQLHMSLQSSPNSSIATVVAGSSTQLTAAQTQYFNQLAAQATENRKQQQSQQQVTQQLPQQKPQQVQQPQSSVIYNSTITSPQSFSTTVSQASFPGASQSYTSVTPSQSFTSMVSSQTFQQSPPATYQSPSSISGSASYSRTSSEYTSSNYSDVMNNYNSMVNLQTNGALPQRTKQQRPTSRQETTTKVIPSNVDIPSAEMTSAMKYLDAQFSALDFNSSDNFDGSSGTSDPNAVAALSNKYSQNVSGSAAPSHAELPAMNTFQATQSTKQSHPSANISAVLNQNNKLPSDSTLQNDNSVYSSQTINNSRIAPNIQDLKSSTDVPTLPYGIPESYQSQQPQSAFQKSSSSVSSSFHQPGTSITSTSGNVYSSQQAQQSQQQQSQMSGTGAATYTTNSPTQFSVYSSNSHSIATATPPLHNSVYHNSSYQPHPAVSGSFQSYMSYPSSLIQPYQAGAASLTQNPYLSTQYGGGSLASLGATYGATAFHSNYGVSSNIQTPVVTLQQKISSSMPSSVASKDSQYESLQAITSTSGNASTTTSGSGISGLSQASTTTSAKVTSSSSSGSKSSSMLPSIPPGVAPLLPPQYMISQGSLPLYGPPTFTLNYDELQYLQRGLHPHMASYLDLNYATPQTNLASAGRETLNVPFSSISDGRFPRPDNTTSPVPPSAAAAAAGSSLSQQNTAPAHQQAHVPMLQTYATYIYPQYQQYGTPVYHQMAPTATATAPGASNSAAITGTQFAKAPAGYNSTGYASQYDSLGSSQADYSSKGSSANSYSNSQQPSKASGNSGSVSGQSSNAGNADLSMYGKSHASLTKSYENKTFHSGTPPPFTMQGSGSSSNNLGNVSNVSAAAGYGPQLYIPNVPTAAAAHQQHHLHQNAHHQLYRFGVKLNNWEKLKNLEK